MADWREILLILCSSAVFASLQIHQSPSSLSLRLGDTANFNCSAHAREEIKYFIYYWYRRDRSRDPTRAAKAIQSNARISVSKGLNLPFSRLVINDIAVTDVGRYYCLVVVEDPLPRREFTGNESSLIIRAKPQVHLFADPESEASGNQTLTCVAEGFFPRDLKISWTVEGDGPYETEPTSLTVNSNGTFRLSSRLRIQTSDWELGKAVTCQVQHITLNPPVSKRISFDPGNGYLAIFLVRCLAAVSLWLVLLLGEIVYAIAHRKESALTDPDFSHDNEMG